MPWLGRQWSTTVSAGLTLVTPGPISSTRAEASCPSRCGRNLSGPLTASISLIWAPQIVVCSTLTSTWPTSSASGSAISSTTSGLRDSARIAARAVLTCIGMCSLFEIDELVVARIAEVLVEPDPGRGVEERLGGERPALHPELLGLVAVALDHDVLVAPDPLDLGKRGSKLEDLEIVQRAERDHEVE